jgi:N-acetylneuraminic acid mutarotase
MNGKEFLLALALIATPSLGSSANAETPYLRVGWTWAPLFPRACSAFGICETPQGVITVGGTYWSPADLAAPTKQWVADVHRLRPKGGQWDRLPNYPTAVGQSLTISINEKVFVIGGRNSAAALAESNWISIHDSTDAWRRGPNLPKPLFGLVGGVCGSTIYAVTDPYATLNEGEVDPIGATVLAWDTAIENAGWVRVSTAPDPDVGYRTAELVDGKLYLFGGARPGNSKELILQDEVWAFDLEKKAWAKGNNLPYPMRDASAAKLDETRILITGGCEDAASSEPSVVAESRVILTNRCLLYDTVADEFEVVEPLRLAVADHGVVVNDSEILVIAGEDSPYRTRTDLVQRGDATVLRQKALTRGQNAAP